MRLQLAAGFGDHVADRIGEVGLGQIGAASLGRHAANAFERVVEARGVSGRDTGSPGRLFGQLGCACEAGGVAERAWKRSALSTIARAFSAASAQPRLSSSVALRSR